MEKWGGEGLSLVPTPTPSFSSLLSTVLSSDEKLGVGLGTRLGGPGTLISVLSHTASDGKLGGDWERGYNILNTSSNQLLHWCMGYNTLINCSFIYNSKAGSQVNSLEQFVSFLLRLVVVVGGGGGGGGRGRLNTLKQVWAACHGYSPMLF